MSSIWTSSLKKLRHIRIWYNCLLVRLGLREILPSDYIRTIYVHDNHEPLLALSPESNLLYNCCGCDATPIIAFGSQYPLYVYVDIVQYGNGDFTEETQKLYKRLKEFGFQEKYKEHNGKYFASADNDINKNNIQLIIEQSELSQWITKHGSSFYLLYIQGDAVTVFWKMYHESRNNNYIQPKCICNFRYEFMDGTKNLNHIEKRARYIMGYAHGEKYKKVGEYKYYGDFGEGTVPLYKRICYYVY